MNLKRLTGVIHWKRLVRTPWRQSRGGQIPGASRHELGRLNNASVYVTRTPTSKNRFDSHGTAINLDICSLAWDDKWSKVGCLPLEVNYGNKNFQAATKVIPKVHLISPTMYLLRRHRRSAYCLAIGFHQLILLSTASWISAFWTTISD
jgi:hypothetical protein